MRCLATLTAALAAPAALSAELPQSVSTLLSGKFFTQLALGLLLVLALAVGLSWMLRRYALPRDGVIRVIGGLPLGTRERLLLIEVDEVRLLIGVTAQHMQTLYTFPRPSVAPFPLAAEASHEQAPS